MSTKKSEKIKDDFIIMKKLIKQKLDEWDTGDIQNEIHKISILEDKPSGTVWFIGEATRSNFLFRYKQLRLIEIGLKIITAKS